MLFQKFLEQQTVKKKLQDLDKDNRTLDLEKESGVAGTRTHSRGSVLRENVFGVASNIFNFTLEFNEKHFNPQFFPGYKQKKQLENFLGELPILVIAISSQNFSVEKYYFCITILMR